MRPVRVTTPSGTPWEVRTFRVRLPAWRQFSFFEEEPDDLFALAVNVVLAPFVLVLLPLACALVELPAAIARAAVSDVAWVEAASYHPEERRLWRTTRADRAVVVAAVVASLSEGRRTPIPRAEAV